MSPTVFAKAALIAAASLPALAAAQSDPGQVATLEEMEVVAPVPPLDRSLLLLRRRVTPSLPCLGCGVIAEGPGLGWALLEYLLLPAEPAVLEDAARLAAEARYAAFGPDLGAR
jgi:hypothetical protein